MDAQLIQKVESALTAIETFKSDLGDRLNKFDAFDDVKFNRIADTVGEALEASQKAAARLEAIEQQQKALETALSRPGAGATETNTKSIRDKHNALFNEFARLDTGNRDLYFHDFYKEAREKDAELKALAVNSDPDGGYLVVPEFGGIVNTRVFETSPMRQLASVTTIGTDSLEIVLDYNEASSGWVGETQSRSETNTPQLGKKNIPTNELYAKPKASQKMLQDSGIDIEGWLLNKVSDKFGRDEATAFIGGDGVIRPRGILTYTAGTDPTQAQIEQVNSGNATALTADGLINLQNALKEPYQSNATWLMRRASVGAVMLLKDGMGNYLFNRDLTGNAGLEASILGRPIRFAADVPAIGAANLAVIYGDLRTAYQIVDRTGITVLRDPYSEKPFVQFYCVKRVGGDVVNFEAVKILKISA